MKKIRILMIDDHPIVRSGLRMLLEQAGNLEVVGEADRGDEAVALIKRLKPDVLLLDMEMPGKTGVEVAREVEAAHLPVHVLALSAHDDEEYIMNLLANGAAGYLTKEEALDTIIDAIQGVANGEQGWFSRRAAARMATMARKRQRDVIDLTDREQEVLTFMAKGWTNNRIAGEMLISERTVRFHLTNIYDKLGVTSRGEAISWAIRRENG